MSFIHRLAVSCPHSAKLNITKQASARASQLCCFRLHSTESPGKEPQSIGTEWRKKQLDKLEKKFSEPLKINSDDELQPMWQQMESRVKNRKPQTLRETGGKSGRENVKKTDEEMWLKEGLYDDNEKS